MVRELINIEAVDRAFGAVDVLLQGFGREFRKETVVAEAQRDSQAWVDGVSEAQ